MNEMDIRILSKHEFIVGYHKDPQTQFPIFLRDRPFTSLGHSKLNCWFAEMSKLKKKKNYLEVES